LPIGVWSTSSTRSTPPSRADRAAVRPAAWPCRAFAATSALQVVAAARRAPASTCPSRTRRSPPSGGRAARAGRRLSGCAAPPPSDLDRRIAGTDFSPRGCERMQQRLRQEAAGDRVRAGASARRRALGDDAAAARAGAGAEVDARGRRGGWCPRRARPPPACCPWRAAWPARRAGCGCRADAGRWSARRARSRRPAGWSRAARPGGCAAPRRRRASARRGPAPGSPGRLRARKDRGGSQFG
jgi:hypothetical protein